ncbi:MAG TPA: hypothetical protein VFV38_23720 [Ktedonobacteraceae bacterium]|nr:hypothetical protein [Ktedonobacteraceae bacterium]
MFLESQTRSRRCALGQLPSGRPIYGIEGELVAVPTSAPGSELFPFQHQEPSARRDHADDTAPALLLG